MIAPSHLLSYSPSTISLNHAWRNTLVHLLIVSAFSDNSTQSLIDAVNADITHNKVAALRGLSLRTGAYFNEADVNEVDWQESFWGSNYGRLRRVKKRYDGEGMCGVRSRRKGSGTCVGWKEGWQRGRGGGGERMSCSWIVETGRGSCMFILTKNLYLICCPETDTCQRSC
jgi:hypothetical protein